MSAAHAVRPAHEGAASSSFVTLSSDDFVVANFCQPDFISEAPIAFITKDRFFGEFGFDCWIDYKLFPGGVNNSLRFWLYVTMRGMQLEVAFSLYVDRVCRSWSNARSISWDISVS